MKVEKSIKISADPNKVWPFVSDPSKIVLWFDTFKKCEYAGEKHSGVGTTYYVEEKVPGPLRKINFEAVNWNENENVTLKMTSGKNVKNYEIQLQIKKDPSGSEFNFKEDVGLPFGFVGRAFEALGQRKAEKMVDEMLKKIKTLSEA